MKLNITMDPMAGSVLATIAMLLIVALLAGCATFTPALSAEQRFADRCVKSGAGLLDGGNGRWFCDAERWRGSRYFKVNP